MFPIALCLLLLLLLISKWSVQPNPNHPSVDKSPDFYCGAEKTDGAHFIHNGYKFYGAATQSTDYPRTGKYASKLDATHQFGMTFVLDHPTPGQLYKAEVWRYTKKPGKSFLVVSAEKKEDFYWSTDKDVETEGSWYTRMELVFKVPENKDLQSLKIYVYKEEGDGILLFDDFQITALDSIPNLATGQFQPQDYFMNIDELGVEKLQSIKERSYSHGVLIKTDADRVKAKVTTAKGIKTGKVRLKGDWLDHIFKGKSSFRIQLDAEDNWQGMQTFSLQTPQTRGMLNEWIYHQFLGLADVLSPRYDFINFHYNGDRPMVYAYEEHFTKNLVENQLRREGPILKFTEDRFWEGMSRSNRNSRQMAGADNKESAFWDAQIKPFKEKKTINNPALHSSFEIAQNLLQQYKHGLKKTAEVFDIHLLAKYLAITDIMQATHALTWHNQRFYYNPVTNLLEPIGFDGFGSEATLKPEAPLYSEKVYYQNSASTEPIDRVFYDPEFIELYLTYLRKYSNPDFIKKFMAKMEEPIAAREQFLKKDQSAYNYDRTSLIKRSNKLQEKIVPFENGIQAFRSGKNEDSMTVSLLNTHILPLEITHIGNAKKLDKTTRKYGWVFPSPQGTLPEYLEVTVPLEATTVYYRLTGQDTTYQSLIANWSTPNNWTPRQELLASLPADKKPYTEEGNLILFENKNYLIEHPLVIPKDKKVVIEPGAHLKFKNKAFLLSFSAIDMRGDEEEPIVIESLDDHSGAVVVMQASAPSLVRYVLFKNQNTVAYKGWNLTGAVTFYESDVKIIACHFIDNRCEDALNTVRSNFELGSSKFKNIFGDAFDADFCKGTVSKCSFQDIGNDALDFSTSTIKITDTNMDGVGDKAISAGERATIFAKNINVNKANIGFASKDQSMLTLDLVNLRATAKGFTAYQKKPEFGAATIHLKRHTMVDVKYPFIIEAGSVLNK